MSNFSSVQFHTIENVFCLIPNDLENLYLWKDDMHLITKIARLLASSRTIDQHPSCGILAEYLKSVSFHNFYHWMLQSLNWMLLSNTWTSSWSKILFLTLYLFQQSIIKNIYEIKIVHLKVMKEPLINQTIILEQASLLQCFKVSVKFQH